MITGKSAKHQKLFVVLTPQMQNAIHRIRWIKKNFPELKDNLYVFAVKGVQKHHVHGNKAFEHVTRKFGLENITAGKLRKLAATNAQFEADPRRRRLLSSILGHDLATHKNIYEEHLCTQAAQFYQIPLMLQYFEKRPNATTLELVDRFLPPEAPPTAADALEEEISGASGVSGAEEEETEGAVPEHLVPATRRGHPVVKQNKKAKSGRGVEWRPEMVDIVKKVFAEALEDHTIPIRSTKVRECQDAMWAKGIVMSLEAIRSKAKRLRMS